MLDAIPTPRAIEPVVDLVFIVRGADIPADHGFCLYSAISRRLPSFHADPDIGIHPIGGRLIGGRRLALLPTSRLIMRLPIARIGEAIRLAGHSLDLVGSRLLVGVPTVHALQPAASLVSRLVVVRGFMEAELFRDAVQRQADALGVAANVSLVNGHGRTPLEAGIGRPDPVIRRTIRIHDKEVVGFAVGLHGLSNEDSLLIQTMGLGGRRRFGCGLFRPVRPPVVGR